MSKLKLESVSSTVFKVGNRSFLKGGYTIYCTEDGIDPTSGIVTVDSAPKVYLVPVASSPMIKPLLPWKTPRPYTDFLDSSGTAYADFVTFSLALANLTAAPANVAANDLVSDKAAVTQATNKTTSVTSNTLSTTITTVALSDAADASFSFTFTNSKISATSIVLATTNMNGGTGEAKISVTPGSGSATVKVTNVGTAAFNSAIKIGLVVV